MAEGESECRIIVRVVGQLPVVVSFARNVVRRKGWLPLRRLRILRFRNRPYVPPVRRRSPVLRIVLVVVGLFLIAAGFLIVKGYYFVKETVQEARKLGPSNMQPAQETKAGCELLAKEDVAKILGTPVAATKGNDAGELREYCNYLSAANVAADAAKPKHDDAEEDADAKDHKPSFKDIESLAKQISDSAKNRPLLVVQVYRGNGGVPVFGIKTADRLTGGEIENVPGPWDEAYFAPQNTQFAVRKGSNAILLDLTQVRKNATWALLLRRNSSLVCNSPLLTICLVWQHQIPHLPFQLMARFNELA